MNIVLSIKPEWAKKIYSGEKTIEFRHDIPRDFDMNTDYIFLYETTPVRAVTGVMKIESFMNIQKIFNSENTKMKKYIIEKGCLSFDDIKQYTPNLKMWGWCICCAYRWPYREFITRVSPSEKPPQSWCYTKASVICGTFNFDHKINEKTRNKEKEIYKYWVKHDGGKK